MTLIYTHPVISLGIILSFILGGKYKDDMIMWEMIGLASQPNKNDAAMCQGASRVL